VSEEIRTTPLRVALLGSKRTIAEYNTFLGHLLVGLADQSVSVALVCPCTRNFLSEDRSGGVILGSAEVINHPVFELPFCDSLNKNMLLEKMVKFEPDILHCLCESLAPLTKYLASRLNVPYVLSVDSLHKRPKQSYFSSEYCGSVIVPSKTIQANLIQAAPLLSQKIEQINIGSFTEDTISCFSDISRPATIIITYPFKNQNEFENLFGAIHRLVVEGYELIVVVVGGGQAETELWKLLAALDLLKIVTIVPRRIPRRPVLCAGDIFIQPKPSKAFDTMLLEAMSVGSAVAACKGGLEDLVIDNETAVLFDPADEMNIMSALQRLLDNRDFAHKIARNAQDYVRKNHSVSGMIAGILQVYNRVYASAATNVQTATET
jgi:glycosyltransferase involved in cell wall biosynthesis